MKVKFKKLKDKAVMPSKAHPTDAGFDLTATSRTYQGGCYVYGTGIAVEIPKGYYGELKSRSSISKTMLVLSNGSGTIDAGYRGELLMKFYPLIEHPNLPEVGDRIGQLIIHKLQNVEFVEADELSDSERGVGGYGSTGR